MDDNKSNNISIDGNQNISLQDIQTNGGNITIVIENGLPQEIKDEKESIANKIKTIGTELYVLSKLVENTITDQIEIENKCFDINWDELIEAIEFGDCVLFIGQEISIDENGISLHNKIFSEIGKIAEVEFNADEGFFEPAKDEQIRLLSNKIAKYYQNNFENLNKKANKILEKLARIPFSQIISITPDNTLHQIYELYDIKHQFVYYQGEKVTIDEPTLEYPVIFNILGEIEKREYIYTHEQFYNYLKNMEMNPKIEEKLKYASHFLFLGFDFNKWYNRLLLFILNISNKNGSSCRHLIQKQNTKEEFKNIINKQFSISFIDTDFELFTDLLLNKLKNSKEVKTRDLHQYFVLQSYNKLMEINRNFIDERTMNGLKNLESEINTLLERVEKIKNKSAKNE